MMRAVFFFWAVFSLSILNVHAQRIVVPNDPAHDDKPVHFGFCLGLNMMDYYAQPGIFKINNADPGTKVAETTQLRPGFNVQIVSNFRLNDDFDFRFLPGLVLGDRTINIYAYEDGIRLHRDTLVTSANQSAYLDFPLLIKYKTNRINNYRPYIIGGLNPRFDLSTSIKNEDPDKPYDGEQKFELQKLVPFYELGVGIDFYLPYFKLGVELKYSRSLGNTLVKASDNPYTSYIDKLNSSVFMFSFYFE